MAAHSANISSLAGGGVTAHDPIFRDDLFAEPTGWLLFHANGRMTQRLRIEAGGAMFTETRLVIRAPVEAIVAKLQGAWTWWREGQYRNRVERLDGTIQYEHFPLRFMIHVDSTMYPPLPLDREGVRIRIEILDYMSGTLYFDVLPRLDGASEFCSRFAGVRVTGPFRFLPYNGYVAARIHLLAERGDFPYPRGTGFAGLVDELEGHARAST